MTPRVVLVTGASSGIGKAAALRVARAGDHLAINARPSKRLGDVAAECRRLGPASVVEVPADVGDDDAVSALVAQVVREHGRLDLVLHCAGVAAYGRVEDVPAAVTDRVLQTNLAGTFNLARHVVPVFRSQRRGRLVVVGSLLGHIAAPTMAPYVVSKWGVRALVHHLQLENRDLPDVQIVHVAPGGVDTPIYRRAASYGGFLGSPPPPVADPDRVAEVMLSTTRKRRQVGSVNNLARLGFTALPGVFDLLVGPLFRRFATDRRTDVPPTEGNVHSPGSPASAESAAS